MIKFKELVIESLETYEFLFESTTNTGFATLSGIYTGTIRSAQFEELKTILGSRYNINISSAPEIDNLCTMLAGNMNKSNPGWFVNAGLHEYFPLIDFLCLVGQNDKAQGATKLDGINPTKSTVTEDIINQQASRVTEHIKTSSGNHPVFNYNPLSNVLRSDYLGIKKKISNLNGVGTVVLENFKNKSIQETFYYLLELRRKARILKVNPEKNPPKPSIDVNGFLYNIYTKGMEKTNPNLQNYNRIEVETLFTFSRLVFEFYKSEAYRHLDTDSDNPNNLDFKYLEKLETGMNSIKGPDPIYKSFISNGPLENKFFVWNSSTKGPVQAKYNADVVMLDGYTLGNIMKLNTDASKELVNELRGLASHIDEGQTVGQLLGSIATGAGNLMSGLSLTSPGAKPF